MNFLNAHPTLVAVGSFWIFSAIVGGMPPPTPTSSQGYIWLYNSLHILAGNIDAMMASKYGQLPPGTKQETVNRTTVEVPK